MRFLAILLAACAAPHAPPTTPAKRYTVHIDTLQPDKATQFEEARRAWVATLREHHATDQRGRFYEVKGVGFVTLRPLGTFAELDGRAAARKSALGGVPPESLKRYDEQSDAVLAFPHTSEVWEIDDDLGYAPAANALDLATAGRIAMVVEEVRPDSASEAAYQRAWDARRRELIAAKYPLTRVTLRSVFGSGRLVTMWLAHSEAELAATPLPEPSGSDVVVRREQQLVIPRPDLSSP